MCPDDVACSRALGSRRERRNVAHVRETLQRRRVTGSREYMHPRRPSSSVGRGRTLLWRIPGPIFVQFFRFLRGSHLRDVNPRKKDQEIVAPHWPKPSHVTNRPLGAADLLGSCPIFSTTELKGPLKKHQKRFTCARGRNSWNRHDAHKIPSSVLDHVLRMSRLSTE